MVTSPCYHSIRQASATRKPPRPQKTLYVRNLPDPDQLGLACHDPTVKSAREVARQIGESKVIG